ncbi:MAG: UbiA prenyltransferase family protein [Candidatus Marinimicrobia bacterium]|nr:UbiA prenyltransferase family protein [Candidatus Neomarinimicrobiota bacterium]
MATAKMSMVKHPLWISNYDFSTFLVFLGITLICSGTFIINQIVDQASDEKNKKLFLIGQLIDVKDAQRFSHIISGLGLFFIMIGNWTLAPFGVFIYLIWGVMYNKPPFELKKHPIFGILTNTVIGIILFLMGWIQVAGSNNLQFGLLMSLMIPYVLCFSAVSLMTNIPDIKGDISESANTFSVKFGRRTTSLIATFFVIVAFYFSYQNSDPIASTASLVSIPFFIFALIRDLDKDILRAIRYPIFLLNFFVFAVYPWLCLSVIMIYYFSKYYYWHRFNLHYPTFLVEND